MFYAIVIGLVLFLGWAYYQIQKRIGEQQARDRAEFYRQHPEYNPNLN